MTSEGEGGGLNGKSVPPTVSTFSVVPFFLQRMTRFPTQKKTIIIMIKSGASSVSSPVSPFLPPTLSYRSMEWGLKQSDHQSFDWSSVFLPFFFLNHFFFCLFLFFAAEAAVVNRRMNSAGCDGISRTRHLNRAGMRGSVRLVS